MRTTGLVLAAGGIAIANEAIFAPTAGIVQKTASTAGGPVTGAAVSAAININWRIVPATLVLALLLGGLEEVAPQFAVILAGMTLGAVLIVQVGNAPTPLENVATLFDPTKG